MDLTLPVSETQFVAGLLDWFHTNKRRLPWRENRDPYRIWVSEVMLQQTRVTAVLPYFERFLRAFPTVQDLAAAGEEEVLSQWSGLGYYSRARNLHRAARRICSEHAAVFPDDPDLALALPGVGRYTAGAVLSIGYGRRVPVLDGNVRRLLIRYLAIREVPGPRIEKALWELLERLVDAPWDDLPGRHSGTEITGNDARATGDAMAQVGDFNEALMELGALVCTPRAPRCGDCPLSSRCLARKAGLQEVLPLKKSARAPEDLHFAVAVVRRDRRFLLRKNAKGPFLTGFWDFPRIAGQPDETSLAVFRRQHGLLLEEAHPLEVVRHQITFRRLHFHPLVCVLKGRLQGEEWLWSSLDETRFPISSHVRKIAGAVTARQESQQGTAC